MRIPPSAPHQGPNAVPATVTTPPPPGLRQETSVYFWASRRKPIVTRPTNSGVRSPTW